MIDEKRVIFFFLLLATNIAIINNSRIKNWQGYGPCKSRNNDLRPRLSVRLAAVHNNTSRNFKLNIQSSIYTAEYVELLKGFQAALKAEKTKFDIGVDSLSAMYNLKNNLPSMDFKYR